MALRLWATIMALVFFSVVFLWVVQIQFFEPNYINMVMDQLIGYVEPVVEELVAASIDSANNPLAFLSKHTKGNVLLAGQDGEILFAYGGGLPSQLDDGDARKLLRQVERNYHAVVSGERKQEINNPGKPDMMLFLGIPASYEGEPAALFVFNSLTEIQTMQALTRRQLAMLSAAMTLVASLLAYFFTRQFTRPIFKIKDAVNRMAGGELAATPKLVRHDELGQLSRSVEELGQALQRVDVLRKEVIANVSHELIAPLSLIIGYVEMVRDITWTDDERRESNLNLISREAGRLSQMVDDIMDYSQFQAGCAKLNKTVCNLYEIVEQEVALERQIASEYAIQVSLDSFSSEITIRADALKISQVIRNLLNNAVNHTANGESIRVYVTREENCVKVSVANPGKPIPEEDRELIWERYRRVQHQGGRRQGTGIGLAIVSTILTAHEMSYGVECTDSENVFWFAYL